MSDHNERACVKCGSLLHHENDCALHSAATEGATWTVNRGRGHAWFVVKIDEEAKTITVDTEAPTAATEAPSKVRADTALINVAGRCMNSLRQYAAMCFPEVTNGQKHFVQVFMESWADAIQETLPQALAVAARHTPTPAALPEVREAPNGEPFFDWLAKRSGEEMDEALKIPAVGVAAWAYVAGQRSAQSALQSHLASAREDGERLDWLLDRASVKGGGDGATYVITFRTPIDTECDRAAIDAARSAKERP